MMRRARPKVVGCPAARAVAFANRWNDSAMFIPFYLPFSPLTAVA
jgi:hypothetical protein